jgi:hypothetical protein
MAAENNYLVLKGLSPSCEESKECKETDKQIPEEACRYPVRKVKNVKKQTEKFQWRVVAIVYGKESKEVPGINATSEEEDEGSMPGISATSEKEDPRSMTGISAALEEEDPGSMPGISATSEEDPGSMHRICNGATTEKEGGGPGFHTRDLRPVP